MSDRDEADRRRVSAEHERIADIRRMLGARQTREVVLGPGDDAALITPATGLEVATVDAAIEGVHFRRGWASHEDLARRAVMAALSDVAAMGGRARACLLALAAPADLGDAEIRALVEGAAGAAEEAGAALVGGNLTRATAIGLTTTVLGEVDPPGLRRTGGRVGDRLWVAGPVGHARVGLEALRLADAHGGPTPERLAPFVEAWRRPGARLDEGRALSGVATAGIDLSDGLAQDLGHLCHASGVGARVELAPLLAAPGLADAARDVGVEPIEAICSGGDDYALLFAVPRGVDPPFPATPVGALVPEDEGLRFLAGGQEVSPGRPGFDHFR